jgi:hypothetical protein
MRLPKLALLLSLSCAAFGCCGLFQKNCPEGCTDSRALNHDVDAEEDDGSCVYSEAVFYAQFGFFNGIPITQIDVSVEGSNIGVINAVYSGGPGNCFATGTAHYQFTNGESISWNTTAHLASGAQIFSSGTLRPTSIECIKVNVTR